MGGIEDKVEKCLQGLCGEFIIRRVNCKDLGDIDHGVYIVISGSDYVIGYSRDLKRRLRMYCLGQLDLRGVIRLLMGRLDNLPPGMLGKGDVIGRRSNLSKLINDMMSNAQVLTVKCASMVDKELYIKLRDCLK
ncbi:GIY-YIG nuclease family protein [Vulcanisaeta distributa]|uniref:GIY-YIG domain-containing protein n=1 Tax=Vulcanisaeta distributa (strain DSM 14429 / JCM 11212 / NBRC 100878 / IC-017) TaxID=572478 RepID=E1QST3_VULDI|nr:GIY-YIG nuclease family protein [Vulcanisaeta distributa]ADN49600.1 hypothetical protein Vdis_0187 [Vulcanisaeta distributa DSM 14429]